MCVVAAVPAWACVAGVAEPSDGAPASVAGQAGAGLAGSSTVQAGSSAVAGAAPTASAGTQNTLGGTSSVVGNATGQAGSIAGAGSPGGGVGGTKPVEACSFAAWMAGKDYAKGDKVMYMGKAFIANDANPGYDPLISTFFWSPYSCEAVNMGGGGSGGTGAVVNNGDCVLNELLPAAETTFHSMFVPPWQGHQEKALYSYMALCTALKGFGQFANSGNAEADKREVAAFFAHVAKETAFLEQTDEAAQSSTAPDFHGRGAIQLTGQANYQAAGDYLQKDLVGNPWMVSTDAIINWQTALWFWVVHNNPGTAGTKNCHQAIQASDFAQTTRIINGGIECPGSQSAQARADYYETNCELLGVSPGSKLVC